MRLVEMSISAGVLILIVALFRKGKRAYLSKRTVMMLWMVVLARLLLPFSLPVRGGIAAPVHALIQKMPHWLKLEAGYGMAGGVVPEAASFGMTEGTGESMAGQGCVVDLDCGIAVTGIYFIISFFKEYGLLMQAVPLEALPEMAESSSKTVSEKTAGPDLETAPQQDISDQLLDACAAARRLAGVKQQKGRGYLWIHDRVRSPMVFGIIKQRIVLPKHLAGLEQNQMQYVLTHEMIHIKRHDNLWKLLAAAAVCMHWFNPLAWLMYPLFSRDLELSCDERVLSLYGSHGKEEYAVTLLALAQNQMENTLFCSGFLENPVKERIVAIMNYKKISGIGVLCAAIMVLGASSVFATNVNVKDAEEERAESAQGNAVSDGEEDLVKYTVRETEPAGEEEKTVSYTLIKTENGKETAVKSGKAEAKEETDDKTIWLEITSSDSEGLKSVNGTEAVEKFDYVDKDGNKYTIEENRNTSEGENIQVTVYDADSCNQEELQEMPYDVAASSASAAVGVNSQNTSSLEPMDSEETE